MGALVLAGTLTLCATLLDHPEVSVVIVSVALIAAIALARPTPAMIGLVAVSMAVEMALSLQTGGGRIGDWDLHYQLARAYAGLSSTVGLADLRQRTPLFDALGGGVLVWGQAYWAFQIVSVVLNSLWLWPAQLLLRSLGANPRGLIVVGLTPMVVLYSVYTWPWGFVSFFVLTAIWAALQRGRLAATTVGVALAGALVTHIGSVGLVAGIAIWVVLRGSHWKHAVVAGSVSVVAPMASWAAFTHTLSPSVLWSASVPARYAGSLGQWLVEPADLARFHVLGRSSAEARHSLARCRDFSVLLLHLRSLTPTAARRTSLAAASATSNMGDHRRRRRGPAPFADEYCAFRPRRNRLHRRHHSDHRGRIAALPRAIKKPRLDHRGLRRVHRGSARVAQRNRGSWRPQSRLQIGSGSRVLRHAIRDPTERAPRRHRDHRSPAIVATRRSSKQHRRRFARRSESWNLMTPMQLRLPTDEPRDAS